MSSVKHLVPLASATIASLSAFAGTGVAGASLVLLGGCGSDNVFEPLVKKDDKDKGRKALEDGDYDAAIRGLQTYVNEHPEDAQARSMLANAYMQKAGLNVLAFGAKVAQSSGGDWKTIVNAMPKGTGENADALSGAVEALKAIPASERTAEQTYQLALAQASLAVTLTKKAAGDGTGLSDAKIDAMSDADAAAIYGTLKESKETVAGSPSLADNKAAGKLGAIADKIAAESGASDADKLKAYLKKNN